MDRVKDFVFDLHDSMRRSQQIEELETLYTTTFKKLRYAIMQSVQATLPMVVYTVSV